MADLTAHFGRPPDQAQLGAFANHADGDSWDTVSIGSGATLIHDSAHAAIGAQSCKVATGGSAVGVFSQWDTKFGTQTDHYGRLYLWLDANPAAARFFCRAASGVSTAASWGVTSTGKVFVADQAGTTKATGAVSVTLGQWVRIEWHITHSTTAGVVQCKLFNTATSSTADETITGAGSFSTLASADRIRFGVVVSTANVTAYWMDEILANATSYPGPGVAGVPRAALLGVGA